jgi:crossover junction endodeoxyribonuclease RuvC
MNSLINTNISKVLLSIDPGYERLGIAILSKDTRGQIQLVHSECFKTDAKNNFSDRLVCIGEHIHKLIETYSPVCLAIETLFLQNNQKTVMKVSETKGTIIYIAKKQGLKVYEFSPLQIKSVVSGSGTSDKVAVQKMVALQVPEIKNKANIIDDEYDALACGLTYFALEKSL